MKPWIIGNWKLNPNSQHDAYLLSKAITSKLDSIQSCHVMVAPSFVHLSVVNKAILEGQVEKSQVEIETDYDSNKPSKLELAAQDVSALTQDTGAYTGDVSAAQLKDSDVTWVIIGHSERRQYYNETNNTLLQKIMHCIDKDLGVIFCIGESETVYEAKRTEQFLSEQLSVIESTIEKLTAASKADNLDLQDKNLQDKVSKLIVAYEPVWAIGTGKIPNIAEVTKVHVFIRQYLQECDKSLSAIPIIYGGSVKPENVAQFAQCNNVNGVLVGGASLDAQSFISIAEGFGSAQASNCSK